MGKKEESMEGILDIKANIHKWYGAFIEGKNRGVLYHPNI